MATLLKGSQPRIQRAFFLHVHPTSDFADGIFIPYASQEEAERQAAWEWDHGGDPENYLGIFESEHWVGPKFGWLREHVENPGGFQSPHLDPDNRKIIHDTASLEKLSKKLAPQLYEEHHRAQEDFMLQQAQEIRRGLADFKNTIPGNAYTWCTGGTATAGPAALAAATAKTVVLLVMAAANQASITEIGLSFDGVTASAVPVLVELISGTAAGAGTPRAALAAGKQVRGWPAQTSQTTAADTYSAEPTAELVNKKWLLTPNGGLITIQDPLGREPTGQVTAATDGKTWGIRLTAPAIVNCHAYLEFEE